MPGGIEEMTVPVRRGRMPGRQATRLRTRFTPGVLPGSVMLIVPVLLVVVWSVNSGSDSFQAATTNGLILLVAALGLSMFWGNSGIMSLGHAAFMAIGAYAGGLVTLDTAIKATSLQSLPHWLRDWSGGTFTAVLVVIGVALIVAAVTGLPLLRMAGSLVRDRQLCGAGCHQRRAQRGR